MTITNRRKNKVPQKFPSNRSMADEWQIMADGKSSAIMYLAINQQINLILWQIAVKMVKSKKCSILYLEFHWKMSILSPFAPTISSR